MPLEIRYTPEDDGGAVQLYLVEPHRLGTMGDYSTGEQETVGVLCNFNDDGGKVYMFTGGWLIDKTYSGELATPDDLAQAYGTVEISDDGESHRQEVTDVNGKLGTFVVRYVAGDAITGDKLIPEGLAHPNYCLPPWE
jgi:hypothetical protein